MATNWAGNVEFGAGKVHAPTSVPELQRLVSSSDRIHPLGTGHSFSRVADGPGDLVSLVRLPARLEIPRTDARTVTVSAGMRWGDVAPALHARGLALHNTGSLPHINVAGSCATGTHGSGDRNRCLAAAVTGLEMVTADGGLLRTARGDDDFAGLVVGLGALGVVTALTLDVQPAFDVAQTVLEGLPWDVVDAHLDDLLAAAYSVSLFTTWRADAADALWLKRRLDEPVVDLQWTGARPADGARHPVPGMSPLACTEQGGVPGPWFERLPHFRLDHTPSVGAELQSEYLLDRRHGPAAVRSLRELADRLRPVVLVSEIRSVAADDLWLSPAHGHDCLGLHFTWQPDEARVRPVVAAVEAALAPYAPRPHWGKVFELPDPAVVAAYPRLADFAALRRRLDPGGRFANAFVDRFAPIAP